jgi:hypothetical protein
MALKLTELYTLQQNLTEEIEITGVIQCGVKLFPVTQIYLPGSRLLARTHAIRV